MRATGSHYATVITAWKQGARIRRQSIDFDIVLITPHWWRVKTGRGQIAKCLQRMVLVSENDLCSKRLVVHSMRKASWRLAIQSAANHEAYDRDYPSSRVGCGLINRIFWRKKLWLEGKMRSIIKRLLHRRAIVHITVIFRPNGDLDKSLTEIEKIINRHPDMDFKLSVQW